MRVIANIHSSRAAGAAGWRARAVKINSESEASIEEVLKAVALKNGTSMYDLIIEKDHLKNDWILFVNGIRMQDSFSLKTNLKDNIQIHLMDTGN